MSLIHASLTVAASSPVHPLHVEADAALRECFPQGLSAHIGASFVDQRSHNERLVQRLEAPDLGAIVDAMALRPVVSLPAGLSDRFASAMLTGPVVGRADVDAEERHALELTLEVVYLVIGRYRSGDSERVARRDELLVEVRAPQARKRARFVRASNKGYARRRATAAATEGGHPRLALVPPGSTGTP